MVAVGGSWDRERESRCNLICSQELQEQQLPVKLQTEEVEEFQDAVEVHSIAGHSSAELVSAYFCCKWEKG